MKHKRVFLAMAMALVLLGIFAGWNYFRNERFLHQSPDEYTLNEREIISDTSSLASRRLAFHDFESGNAADPNAHLSTTAHHGKQSLQMGPAVSFSPGLWIKFKDLIPGDSLWIRASGYVWFSCAPTEVKCSLVATCNHNGVNYKYFSIPFEKEAMKPNQWNRIGIDYHIPPPPDREDVVQVYFWYRGTGEMLVDDIEVRIFEPKKQT